MDWQPIETAPKDNIIVLTDSGALWQGFWQDGYGWITGFDDGRMHVRVILNPTHWAPLPEQPGAAYMAGLLAAEEACLARHKMHKTEVNKWPSYDAESRSACLVDALEALECASAIKALRVALDALKQVEG